MSLLTIIEHIFDNNRKSMNKTIKIADKDLNYLKALIRSESEKFEEVAKISKDPDIKEESKILNNLNRQLSL